MCYFHFFVKPIIIKGRRFYRFRIKSISLFLVKCRNFREKLNMNVEQTLLSYFQNVCFIVGVVSKVDIPPMYIIFIYIIFLFLGRGLPAGLAEIEMIERARIKRAWYV